MFKIAKSHPQWKFWLCVYYCATFNFFFGYYIILKVNCNMFYISTICYWRYCFIQINTIIIILSCAARHSGGTIKCMRFSYTARHGGSPAAARPAPGSDRPRRPHPGQLRAAAVPGR